MAIFKKTLNKEDVDKCSEFAEKCVDTNLDEYKRRRQFNREKIKGDIQQGKMAELAIKYYLEENHNLFIEPDFDIYESNKKNYSADLKTDDMLIHVKSQNKSVADKYGTSWVFQKFDKLVSNPKEKDHLALCVVDGLTIELHHLISASLVKDLYKEPKLVHLKSKAVLYNEDLTK